MHFAAFFLLNYCSNFAIIDHHQNIKATDKFPTLFSHFDVFWSFIVHFHFHVNKLKAFFQNREVAESKEFHLTPKTRTESGCFLWIVQRQSSRSIMTGRVLCTILWRISLSGLSKDREKFSYHRNEFDIHINILNISQTLLSLPNRRKFAS